MVHGRAGRVKPLARLFFALFLAAAPAAAAPSPETELHRLAARSLASRLDLANDPYWLKLLYYEKTLLGHYRSPSTNPQFFLSRWGSINPRLELEAHIDGLFAPGSGDDSPECRFPERYRWLRARLSAGPEKAPVPECRSFEEWKAGLDPESVSLLFAAGYLNNPSTLYGHTFLRLHKRGGGGADLLDYTVNYAATTDEQGGFLYALKGLIGAYPGQFSTIPYYLKIQEYHNIENRDLWEFPLGLTREEIDRLLRHCWELGKAAFPYKFFTRNCSWQLMPLLDIVRPGHDLAGGFRFWAIPSDTAKAALAGAPPAEPVWRPSLWKNVEAKRAALSPAEREAVLDLARGDAEARLRRMEAWPAPLRAAVLETAADYLSWRFYAGRIKKEEQDRRMDPLLARRAALGEQPPFSPKPTRPASIMEARESLRVGLGLVSLEDGPAYEVQGRFAAQDPLDDPTGYLPDAALEMGSFRGRYDARRGRFYLKEGTVARVLSLNPWDDWVRRQSWEVRVGLEQAEETGREPGRAAVWAMSAGAGAAAEVRGAVRQVWFAMLQAETAFGGVLDSSWRAGAGPKAGVLAEKGRVRALLEARYISFPLGDGGPLWAGSAAASLRLARNSSLRAEFGWRGDRREAGVYLHHFFFPP